VIDTILDVCTCNAYDNVINFAWLVCDVMFTLALNLKKDMRERFEPRIAAITIEIATRLEDVRKRAITKKVYEALLSKDTVKELAAGEDLEFL
jgi:hypothetical protein